MWGEAGFRYGRILIYEILLCSFSKQASHQEKYVMNKFPF